MTVCMFLFLGLAVLGSAQDGPRGVAVAPTLPPVSPVERRVALVIGNDRYQHVNQLERAVSDAQAVGTALRQLGFEILARSNLDREGMIEAIGALADRIAPGGVGVLFFAGHGVQLGGENFLLPIDIKAARADDLPDKAMALGRVMERLAQAQAKFTLLILDACRDNPFPKVAGRTIGGTRGLTIPAAPDGLMVIYSAGINEQALDRLSTRDTDPNGLFTRELLKYLPQPGLPVDDMLKRVRGAVRTQAAAIGHTQNPAIYDQSSGDFYFVIEETRARPETASGNDDAVEIAFWNSVKDANHPDALHAYLQQYPQGKFASLAQVKLKELRAPPKPPVGQPDISVPVDIAEGASAVEVAQEKRAQTQLPPAPVTPPAPPKQLNLLAPKNGGQVMIAPHDFWLETIDGKEHPAGKRPEDDSPAGRALERLAGIQRFVYYPFQPGEQAVFAFQEERPATFDTFRVLIPGAGSNLNEFALFVADEAPTGPFRLLGKFSTMNAKIVPTQGYQEFKFPVVTAKYLKVQLLSGHEEERKKGMLLYEFQLVGMLHK
jgi:hypothetical protein